MLEAEVKAAKAAQDRIVIGHKDARWKLHLLTGDNNPLPQYRSFEDVVEFKRNSFQGNPVVHLSISMLDATPGTLANSDTNNVRVSAYIISADKDGFRYRVETWDNSRVWGIALSWLAIGP